MDDVAPQRTNHHQPYGVSETRNRPAGDGRRRGVARNNLHPLPRHGLARDRSGASASDTFVREGASAPSPPPPPPARAALPAAPPPPWFSAPPRPPPPRSRRPPSPTS